MTIFVDRPPDPHSYARVVVRHFFPCPTCLPELTGPIDVSPLEWENRAFTFELFCGPDLSAAPPTKPAPPPLCPEGKELLRVYAEAVTEWWHWHLLGEVRLEELGAPVVARHLMESGHLPRCDWTEDQWRGEGLDVDDFAAHICDCDTCVARSGYIFHDMGSSADELLLRLERSWRTDSGYQDTRVRYWRGTAIAKTCPHGCRLDDLGWACLVPMGAPAYLRTLCCRDHKFARLYVITVAQTDAANWLPPDYFNSRVQKSR